MLGGILTIAVLGYWLAWTHTTLIVEVWGLTLFGIGWLAAGSYKTEAEVNPA